MDFDFEKEFERIWNSTGADPRYPAKQYMQPYLDAGYSADPVSDLRRSSIDWSKYSHPEPKPKQDKQASSVDWNSYKKDDYWANVEKAGAGNDYWANVEKKGQQKQSGNFFDQFDEPGQSGRVDWNSYKQTGPKSFDLGATFNDFASGATDAAAGALAGAEHVGRNLERFLSPINQGRAVAGAADWVFGGRSFGDAYDQMFGGVMNRPTFEQQYEKYGYKPANENIYGGGKFLGEAMAIPGFGAGGFGLKAGIGLGAAEGAVGAGLSEVGEQVEKGQADPMRLAASLGLGTVAGGVGGAGAHYLNELISGLAPKVSGMFKKGGQAVPEVAPEIMPTPAATPIMEPVEGAPGVLADMRRSGLIDDEYLDPEDIAALMDLGLVGEKPRMRLTKAQAKTGLIESLTPDQPNNQAAIDELTGAINRAFDQPGAASPAVSRRFAKGNSGEATDVVFPDELSAKMNDLGSKSRRAMSGGDSGIYGNQKTKQLQQEIADELGLDTAQAATIARQFNKAVREQARAGGERIEAPSIHEFIKPTGKPTIRLSAEQVSDPANLIGDQRFQLGRDAQGKEILGHARGSEGLPLDEIGSDILADTDKALVRQLAERQLALKAATEHEAYFAQKLQDMGIDEMDLGGHKYSITERKPEMKLTREGQKEVDAAKFRLAEEVSEPIGGGPRATVSKDALQKLQMNAPEPSGDAAKDAAVVKQLYEGRLAAKKDYDKAREAMTIGNENVLERAQRAMHANDPSAHFMTSVDVNGHRVSVEHAQPRIEKRFRWDEWRKIARKELKGADDETINARMKEHFSGLAKKLGRSSDEWADVAAEAEERSIQFQDELSEINDIHRYAKQRPPRVSRKKLPQVSSKAMSNALIGGGIAYESMNQQAQAADDTLGDKLERRGAGLSRVGAGMVIAGAVLRAKPAMVKKVIESGAAKASHILGDTVDAIGRLDTMADAEGKLLFGRNGQQGLAQDILAHNAAVLKSRMGIKFDSQQVIDAAREQLIRGKLTARQALAGKADTAFEAMTKEQRNAIVTEYLGRKTLAGKVRKMHEKVAKWWQKLDKAEQAKHMPTMMHLESLNNALNGKGQKDIFAAALSNTMAFHFQANPAFHALNLTDSIIAGSARVGPLKMARAWKMLGTDKDIKDLFKNSNIMGGIKAEAAHLGGTSKANNKAINPKDAFDFNSDGFNADRVTLASMLASYDEAVAKGVTEGEKDFLKAVVTNKPTGSITKEVIDDAWINVADHGLRVLNVDPYRINRNIVSAVPGAHYFAAFINQPARLARMANEYVADGDYRKLAIMLGFTAAIAGKAALPTTLRNAWEFLDPESAFAVESTLDDMSLPSLASGAIQSVTDDRTDSLIQGLTPDLSRKLEWDPLFMLGGSGHPGIEAARKSVGTITDAGYNLINALQPDRTDNERIDDTYKAGKSLLGLVGQTAASNVKGVPVGVVERALKAGKQTYDGEIPLYHYENDRPYAGKSTLNLDTIPGGRVLPFMDMLLPGDSSLIAREAAAKREGAKRKKRKAETNRQAYKDPLAGLVGG